MTIYNVTKGVTVADRAKKANSFLARGRGLMMAPPLAQGGGLVIEPCNSIHMFFMRYPLDIIFLDEQGTVLFMYEGIKPWRMGRVVRRAKCAVELPEGAIAASRTEVGDKLQVS
jgi:uncharacterized membrane protein (UPF0127 family)